MTIFDVSTFDVTDVTFPEKTIILTSSYIRLKKLIRRYSEIHHKTRKIDLRKLFTETYFKCSNVIKLHSIPVIRTVRLTGIQLQSSLMGLLVIRTKCFFVPIMNVRLTRTEVLLTRTSPCPRYPDRYCFVRLTGVRIMGTKFCPDNKCPVNECPNNLRTECILEYL
jgi:hypothetical protein